MAYMLIFLLKKMWVAFAFACELAIVLTRTVNVLTTNELIKLTMLWTNGPWFLQNFAILLSTNKICFVEKKKKKKEENKQNKTKIIFWILSLSGPMLE